MSIQEEIHKAMQDLEARIKDKQSLSTQDLSLLLLTSLIEEEGPNANS